MSPMVRASYIVWILVGLGCSSLINNQAASSTYRILMKSQEAARRQPDLELARAAIPGGLIQLESFALAYPHHRGFKALYAESLCQYAVAFVFDDWEDAQLDGRDEQATRTAIRLARLLDMCVDANLSLLPPVWRAARARDADAWAALVHEASRDQVPALLWIASSDAVVVALDPMRNLGKLATILATLTRCIELAPGFHDADAELLLGALQAGTSRFLGGPDGSEQFARARRMLGEGALLVEVMFARSVAVARKDRVLFDAALRRVLDTDVTRWPERRLGNELALVKARRYLDAIDKLVPSAP